MCSIIADWNQSSPQPPFSIKKQTAQFTRRPCKPPACDDVILKTLRVEICFEWFILLNHVGGYNNDSALLFRKSCLRSKYHS